MLAARIRKEKCMACFGSLAYLAGYCPVCHDTGFVEIMELETREEPLQGGDLRLNPDPVDLESPLEQFSIFI